MARPRRVFHQPEQRVPVQIHFDDHGLVPLEGRDRHLVQYSQYIFMGLG
jgi:hypothetical protein